MRLIKDISSLLGKKIVTLKIPYSRGPLGISPISRLTIKAHCVV
jgi:hypothetical protein